MEPGVGFPGPDRCHEGLHHERRIAVGPGAGTTSRGRELDLDAAGGGPVDGVGGMEAAQFRRDERQITHHGEAVETRPEMVAEYAGEGAIRSSQEYLTATRHPAIAVQGDGDVHVVQPASEGGSERRIDQIGRNMPAQGGRLLDGVERCAAGISGSHRDLQGAALESTVEGHDPDAAAMHSPFDDLRVSQQLAPGRSPGGFGNQRPAPQ